MLLLLSLLAKFYGWVGSWEESRRATEGREIMKKKPSSFERLVSWVLGLFGYHIARNPPKGRKRAVDVNELLHKGDGYASNI